MWSYELKPLQTQLLEREIIDLGGTVDKEMAAYVRIAMAYLTTVDSPNIEIRITSNGGDVEYGLDIYDMIRLYPSQVTGTVFASADSIASIILQACEVRRCTQHSTILIHNISFKIKLENCHLTINSLQANCKEWLVRLKEWQKSMNEIYSRRTGRSIAEIKRQCKKDTSMLAKEALNFRLIDEII